MTHPSQRTSTVLPSLVTGNSSFDNLTQHKQYVLTSDVLDFKLTVNVLIAVAATVGFVGNLCVLRFTNNEQKKPVRARSSNLISLIRSLALSDVLGSLIGAPLLMAQMNYNAMVTKFPCNVSRFIQSVFVVITIYNIVVIGVERYICTCRPTSRPLSVRVVRKSVKGAWLLGFLVNLVEFSYPVEPTIVYMNSTHYILTCEYDYNDSTTRVIQPIRGLVTFTLPTIILVFTCASIMRVLWRRKPRIGPAQQDSSGVVRKWRLARRKATKQLTAIVIAFIIPLSASVVYAVFVSIFAPSIEFETDFMIRRINALLVYLNGPVNFVIHLAQLRGFRQAMKGYVVCCRGYRKVDQAVQRVELGRIRKPDNSISPLKAEGCKKRWASMLHVQDAKTNFEILRRYSF